MRPPLSDPASVRAHVELKAALGELRPEIVTRMLAALEGGARADYAALLRAATFPVPPPVVYHTAPPAAREAIRSRGLEALVPGRAWQLQLSQLDLIIAARQPQGVYCGPEPDTRGKWAHWPAWDVWAIERGEIPWDHDLLSPGCWLLAAGVPPAALTLHDTYCAVT